MRNNNSKEYLVNIILLCILGLHKKEKEREEEELNQQRDMKEEEDDDEGREEIKEENKIKLRKNTGRKMGSKNATFTTTFISGSFH